MFRTKIIQPNPEGEQMLRDAMRNIVQPSRRAFLQRTLTLGGMTLLTGCTPNSERSIEAALTQISRWNDRVQGMLFDPTRLAPIYPDSMITRPFPFNAYYGEDEVRQINGDDWRLELSGLIADRAPWRLEQLRQLPQETQVTRHICVEGWSAIGKWGGVPFASFLRRIGADLSAKYIGFLCADDYYTSIDMASALHPQTLMALTYDDRELPPRYGFPMKLRIPTKLGYKNPKHVHAIFVTNTYLGGYWEDRGYNWFGGS
ncbi:molybdopterin-dependent oxidoreductase [Noviherbaspirillum sp. CPCC 100848]|uniref:Molybdopterin-dependent oxidoreductase n=2 Tax=Noviherbaspirillum album TaxID=3080276 RepID=A0ABU6JDM2_9BURK|nr:molybdopterin-dependent oxidoreductase [Noviherbaspirillum sp. CPCC 100848]MEC4721745.1 molybdopterin-dependent oxidoreductase [Noviherbaspirillum sp. CPCC 100848]